MKILIISLPRTGSTSLMNEVSIKNNIKAVFEPFNPLNTQERNIRNFENSVVKTIIFHKPNFIEEKDRLNWVIELTYEFDKTILLSRRDEIACAESWAFLNYKSKRLGFTSTASYLWEETPNYSSSLKNVQEMNNELRIISEKINVPITYYEDIFDPNGPKRLRKGNRNDINKNII